MLRYASLAQSRRLVSLHEAGKPVHVKGLVGSAADLLQAAIHEQSATTSLILAESDEDAAYAFSDLQGLYGPEALVYFPSSFGSAVAKGRMPERTIQRLELVGRQAALAGGQERCIIISSLAAVGERFVSAARYASSSMPLEVGQEIPPEQLAEQFEALGFAQVEFVYEPGQYARRGSIVDVFSYADALPYRIDFLGDSIDSIRQFDVETQLSTSRVESMMVVSAASECAPDEMQHLLAMLPPETFVWGTDLGAGLERYADWRAKMPDSQHPLLLEAEELRALLQGFALLEQGISTLHAGAETVQYSTTPQPVFKKNFNLLAAAISSNAAAGTETLLLADQRSQLWRLESIFNDLHLPVNAYQLVQYALRAGFTDSDLGVSIFTDHQLFDRFHKFTLRKQLPRRDALSVNKMQALKPGDYVVHVDHGIGIFEGLVRREENGTTQEYVCLSYRDKDTLLVRIHNLHRLSKYRGKEGEPPVVHKLGSGVWARMKQRAKGKMKDIARELILLYARRRTEEGFAFSPDSYLQEALEASFIYQDTPDQIAATQAVKQDMERPIPMDRLVCGDVGFGKTEIAVRAAFKATADSKQVAVLVPTTVLALQHYKTFSSRLAEMPCRVELLSRMRSAKEQRAILDGLREGRVDIVIGTHALLRSAVDFHDLGLLIVDEEQKFGVAAKDKLKQLRASVDTLTLTATPIPRTLQFSLMGARDLSIISTPPPNRYPIHTEVCHFDRGRIAEAIHYEVNRGGQIFFIHNVVQSLPMMHQMLCEIVPDLRIAVAHGQMRPTELEQVMLDFMAGDYDVLLCTAIVESGLDIPNANTIIINDGHRFGLSDLHQLRGRVGRTNQKAYCYVLIPYTEELTAEARRRLKALEEFSELGSGMNIAMQDLDIRGAGNLLGAEQSGFIVDLGFETYHRILDEAMHELKLDEFKGLFPQDQEGMSYVQPADCIVESDLDISLPEDFVQSPAERLRLYREIDSLHSEEELTRYVKALRDRFGELPEQAKALVEIPPLKWHAAELGVEKVLLRRGQLTLQFVRPINSPFYQSELFGRILGNVKQQVNQCQLRQSENALRLEVRNVPTVSAAIEAMQMLARA